MRVNTVLALLAVGALGYLVARRYRNDPSAPQADAVSPYRPVIEEVLHQHQGEDSPMVHAFEAALEEERHHEEQLAHETGVQV
jgi:hypothetical protein